MAIVCAPPLPRFEPVTVRRNTYLPGVSAGATAVFTVIASAPVDWSGAHPTWASVGADTHDNVPRSVRIPAPVLVTVTVVGPAVPPAATVRFTTLALSDSTGCRIVNVTVTFCGLLKPLAAVTGTTAGGGLVVRPVGLAVKTSVSPVATAHVSQTVGFGVHAIVPSAPLPVLLTLTFLIRSTVLPRIAWKFRSLGESAMPGVPESDTVTVRVTALFGALTTTG